MNFYLRDITFVTDVSVPTIETIKPVFKPIFLTQFHFLKPLGILALRRFWNKQKRYVCEKGNNEDANEDVDKVCIEVQKTSDNTGWKPTRGFSRHSTQNI